MTSIYIVLCIFGLAMIGVLAYTSIHYLHVQSTYIHAGWHINKYNMLKVYQDQMVAGKTINSKRKYVLNIGWLVFTNRGINRSSCLKQFSLRKQFPLLQLRKQLRIAALGEILKFPLRAESRSHPQEQNLKVGCSKQPKQGPYITSQNDPSAQWSIQSISQMAEATTRMLMKAW